MITTKRKLVSFRIPENLNKRINIKAAERGIQKQYFVEELLVKGFKVLGSKKED